MKRASGLAALSALTLLIAGCIFGPNNGTTFTEPNIATTSVAYSGYWNAPNTQVELQAMTGLAPWSDASWSHFAFATTAPSSNPTYFPSQSLDATPLYAWQTYALPTVNGASVWAQGGLMRLRARVPNGSGFYYLQVYDDGFIGCFNANPTAQWQQLGTLCGDTYPDSTQSGILPAPTSGVGTVEALVSTVPVPADNQAQYQNGVTYLTWKSQSGTVANTNTYYGAILAPATLSAFMLKYGYLAATDVGRAVYYNQYDIGLGSDVSCWSFSSNGDPKGGRACIDTYYGTQPYTVNGQQVYLPAFNNPAGLTQATSGSATGRVSTLAIAYEPGDSNNPSKLIAYDANGNLSTTAQLDYGVNGAPYGKGGYKAVPDNCLACHGAAATLSGSYNSLSGAQLLPLDEFSVQWSGTAPYRQQDQEAQIRQINSHVLHAAPLPGITEFLNGLYPQASGAPGSGPDYAQNSASAAYIPAQWNATRAGQTLYNEVDKHYCRNCHLTMGQSGGLDWMSYNHFVTSPQLQSDVCNSGGHLMPQAEQTARLFWQSPARAHLVTAMDLPTNCAP